MANKVKLDTKGLTKFKQVLGRKGIRFNTGVFKPDSAYKAIALEYGTEKQVARPWMSSAFYPQSETRNNIVVHLRDMVRDLIMGKNSKKKTALAITKELQEHLLDQKFSAKKLTKKTIANKRYKGSVTPDHIGLDTYEMVADIQTKLDKGGVT